MTVSETTTCDPGCEVAVVTAMAIELDIEVRGVRAML
jgi:hypothetical protein